MSTTFAVWIETDNERLMSALPDRIYSIASPAVVSQPQGAVYQFTVPDDRARVVRQRLDNLSPGDVRVVES